MTVKRTPFEVYQKFDEAAAKEAASPAPKDFATSIRRLKALIDVLPQRALIEEKNIERWLERTIKVSVERVEAEFGEDKATIGDAHTHALWHVRRASAIGGSEIGTIVKNFRGQRGSFTSAHNLALDKLLIMAPMPSTPEMARGNKAEPWLQKMYLEENGCVSDEEVLEGLKGYRWEKLPQIVGTPDDVALFPTGHRRLVDYKCPSADVNKDYEANGIAFDYKCQVHHYGILAQARGTLITDMEVASFDPRYFSITPYKVERDPELIKEMMIASRRFWDEYVMQGLVPDKIEPDTLDLESEQIREIGVQAAILKILSDEVATRQKEFIERISGMGSEWHDLAEGKMELGFAAFSRKRKWDEDVLVKLAKASGINTDDHLMDANKLDAKEAEKTLKALHKLVTKGKDPLPVLQSLSENGLVMEKKINVETLLEALEEAGVDTISAAGLSESFRISTKTKGEDAEAVREIKDQVSDLVDALETVVEDAGKKILAGPAGSEEDEMNP